MILEANRIVATWLADPTYGVNALLPGIPYDAGDSAPDDIVTIVEETNDGDVARDELPADLPAIGVSVDVVKDLDGAVQTITADGMVKLRIRVGLSNPQTADGKRDLSYYLRAVMRSFRVLMTDAHTASRIRNQVYLETCSFIDEAIVFAKDQQGSSLVVGYILPTVQLRDLQPLP